MDGLDALIKSFARLGDDTAAAGIFADEENATKAMFAEFGTVTAPPRPFMSRAAVVAEQAAARAVRDTVGENVDGASRSRRVVAKSPAKAAADLLAEAMRREIDKGVPPPLAESTLAARRSRGNSDTTPLRDTGAMRGSIASKAGPGEGGGGS